MSTYKVTRERVIELLNKHGYFTTTVFEDGEWEQFARPYKDKDGYVDTTFIYLGISHLDSEVYPISYDYRFKGCERGIESFIIGTFN